jgi:ABC-2 type transport system permease protein
MSTVTLGRVSQSEWVKLRTLRSTVTAYALIAAALVVVTGVVIVLPSTDTHGRTGDQLLVMLVLVELLVGITGVLGSTSEYSAQTIRSTLVAVPRRVPVLISKLLVHGGLVIALFLPATLAGLVAAMIFAPQDVGPVTDAVVLQGIGGSALVLGTTCMLGVALGMLTRSTPAAIAVLFCLMFLPVMATFAPAITAFLPGRLAQAVVLADNPPEARLLGGAAAAGALVAWTVVAVGVAAVALRRRDA